MRRLLGHGNQFPKGFGDVPITATQKFFGQGNLSKTDLLNTFQAHMANTKDCKKIAEAVWAHAGRSGQKSMINVFGLHQSAYNKGGANPLMIAIFRGLEYMDNQALENFLTSIGAIEGGDVAKPDKNAADSSFFDELKSILAETRASNDSGMDGIITAANKDLGKHDADALAKWLDKARVQSGVTQIITKYKITSEKPSK